MKKKSVLVVLCSILFLGIGFSNNHISAGKSDVAASKYDGLYAFYKEKKNSIDMLFLGDSFTRRSININKLWKERGITGYNLATSSQPAWLSYEVLREALTYQTPKLVVLDINLLFSVNTKKDDRYGYAINALKADAPRLEALQNSNMSKDKQAQLKGVYMKDLYMDMVKRFFSIHDKKEFKTSTKGFVMDITTVPFLGYRKYMDINGSSTTRYAANSKEIDKIINLCESKQIPLLFICVPVATEWNNTRYSMAKEYAQTKNIPYVDFNVAPYHNLLDWNADTRDGGTHINYYGANKITAALETYLDQNYTFTKTSDPQVIKSYDKDSELSESKIRKAIQENKMGDIQ